VPQLDSPLSPIIARCLAKSPAERYASFGELRGEIEALLLKETGEVFKPAERKGLQAWELCNKGISLGSLGRWEEALACYDQALALGEPRASILHNNRGNALQQLGRDSEAAAAFDLAIELDSSYAEPWVNKGRLMPPPSGPRRRFPASGARSRSIRSPPRPGSPWG
jgi:tetratricopeptide (TPR) repeat protein